MTQKISLQKEGKHTLFSAMQHQQRRTQEQCTLMQPVPSQYIHLKGCNIILLAYDYDTNYVFTIPITDVKDETLVEAFDTIFKDLTKGGYKPIIKSTDNQAVRPIKAYLKEQRFCLEFVEPSNHRVNTVERAIKLSKATTSAV